jgi:hypothetical protein
MADVKITDLTAVASVAGTNTFEVTEDPSGTPVSKKATAAQLATYIDAAGAASSAVSTHVAAGDPHTQYKLESDFSANGASLVNAANYSAMRTLLSLVPGTDVQAFSSVLSIYAGIAPSANVQTLLGAADFAAFRTSLSLVVGTNVQAYDADLATIAGLTATTDNFLQAKSSAWASRTPTQVTADLIAMVGDSGSGGTKGLVPAPAAGDAAAAKYLKADGTWATVSGGGSVSDTAYASSWDADTTTAPSKNAVYDKFVSVDASLRPAFIAGNWYALIPYASYAAGAALVQDSARFIPFVLQYAITISDLGARITTAHAANNIQLAIYANNATTMRPTGSELAATGNITTASTGAVSADITGSDVTLQPGLYWMGVNSSASTVVCQVIAAAASLSSYFIGATALGTVTSGGTSMVFNLSTPLTFGTWGDLTSATWTQNATNAYAVLFLKAA